MTSTSTNCAPNSTDFAQPEKKGGRSPREERIIAGFEEIQRFVEKHGRAPQHGEDRDIFERLYAVRLDRLRALARMPVACSRRSIIRGCWPARSGAADEPAEPMDEDELLAELEGAAGDSDITNLRHVRAAPRSARPRKSPTARNARTSSTFKPLFQQVQKELESGDATDAPFRVEGRNQNGQRGLSSADRRLTSPRSERRSPAPHGRTDARLRVIFDNGTESNMLMRSLQRALNKDEAGRRITDPVAGPLFSEELAEDDQASGTIYVLRSKSDHPLVSANRDLVHKIGVTNLNVEQRVAGRALAADVPDGRRRHRRHL